MPTPARFPNGITNRAKAHPFGAADFLDPFKWVTYYDDFVQSGAVALTQFTFTEATGNSTQALSAGLGGWLLLSHPATTDDSLLNMQLTTAPFTIRSGKKAVFGIRMKSAAVIQNDLLFGMTLTDTTIVDAASAIQTPTGIFFYSADGAATYVGTVRTGSASTTSSALGTLVADTFVELAWAYNGVDTISFFVDGVKVLDQTTLTNIPTSAEALNIAVVFNTGDNVGTQTMSIDWILAAVER